MTTYGTMKTRVASEILRPSWADTHVANAIQDAIKDYDGQRFAFNVGRFRLTTVADQEEYTVPADIDTAAGDALETGETLLEIESMSLRYNTSAYIVTPVTEGWLEHYTTTATTGQPIYYCWTGTRLRFAPVPDQAYTVHILGMKRLQTLSAADDTNAWMVDGEKLIRSRAKAILYRDVLRNPGQAKESERTESDALAALNRQLTGQQPARLQAWGY